MAGMAKQWRIALAATLLAVCVVAAPRAVVGGGQQAQRAPFLGGFLQETRIVYPLQVGEWQAEDEHLYDEPALGASVRYRDGRHRDRWIDLYFYPAGVLPPSGLDEAAQRTLDEIGMGVGRPGGYVEAEFGELRAFEIAGGGRERDGGRALTARSADMRLLREEGAYHSAMVLLVDRLYYVKGRYSVGAAALSRGEARAGLEAFVAEVVRTTSIGSTGDCWTLAEAGGHGLAGCTGAEPSNPEVPEGSREIRLEYRAPRDADGDGGRRLYPTRSGVG